jgi:hypothetical protein
MRRAHPKYSARGGGHASLCPPYAAYKTSNAADAIDPDQPRTATAAETALSGAVRLRDDWARRELKIVVRDQRQLSATGRLVLDHLRNAEGAKHAVPA